MRMRVQLQLMYDLLSARKKAHEAEMMASSQHPETAAAEKDKGLCYFYYFITENARVAVHTVLYLLVLYSLKSQLCNVWVLIIRMLFECASVEKGGGQKKKKKKANKKYEYDSDEEIDDEKGTWEHQARNSEMDATRGTVTVLLLLLHRYTVIVDRTSHHNTSLLRADYAQQLTEMGRGKHFLGDFLPPDELAKFLETFKARQSCSA